MNQSNMIKGVLVLGLVLPSVTTSHEIDEVDTQFFDVLENYLGYQKLLSQTSFDTTMQVINLIENSKYPELIKSIIEIESSWNVKATSWCKARGLMQLMDICSSEINPNFVGDKVYEPINNVKVGIEVFEDHMKYYNEAEHWALTAYNRGRGGLANMKSPPISDYSLKVMQAYEDKI